MVDIVHGGDYKISLSTISLVLFSRIDPSLSRHVKVYPLPHMYVIKDLVPVSKCSKSLLSTYMIYDVWSV